MKQKILVAMSGGVDSSVAALLLKKQGYDVIGAFMKNWSNTKNKFGECLWRGERKVALKIAAKLNIPLITFDFEKQYKRKVIDKMFEGYSQGQIPNPDIECNKKIKFPLLIKEAKKLGIDKIATGHYVRIRKKKSKYELLRAKDESKDQSYFLYKLSQKELKHCVFPIGNYTKKQAREIAKKNNFPNYNKKSTTGICFVGDVNMKNFLKKKIASKKGKILDPDGNAIGEHDGIYYYAIGQRIGPRHGLKIKKKDSKKIKRWYVAKKNFKKNEIIAAPQGHSLNYRKKIIAKQFHLISDEEKKFRKKTKKVLARIRHVGELLSCKLKYNKKKKQFEVILKKPITGISRGQAVVLYKRKKCLGGGVIDFG